jgi:lambda repressor-like predicted transcriptional regulator
MENANIEENQSSLENSKTPNINPKTKNYKTIAIIVGVGIILVALLFAKSWFIAATVNGSPITRLSLIRELEKQGGKQTLERIIDQKLIEAELNKKGISVSQEEVNGEIKSIEAQITSQGSTLPQALAMQGLTEEKLREQITIQKKIEKLLADKIVVTDEEIEAYMKDSETPLPKDIKLEDFKKEVSVQIKQQKLQQEAKKWISDLTTNAKIRYYVNY